MSSIVIGASGKIGKYFFNTKKRDLLLTYNKNKIKNGIKFNILTDKIEDLVNKNETIYDMFGDKTSKKYGDDKRKKLEKYDLNKLPIYIQENKDRLKEWID